MTSLKAPIVVIKFGSSVLTQVSDIPKAVHETYQYVRQGYKVLVIVSAIGETTDQLIQLSNTLFADAPIKPLDTAYAALLSAGETVSSALLTIALDAAGIPAYQLDHTVLQTEGSATDAVPVHLRQEILLTQWETHAVLVMPGFIGSRADGAMTLLGRGGSDFSAVFAAWALGGTRCVLYKNTDGIFDHDPETVPDIARRYTAISYHDCLQIPYPVVQHKAIQFAEEKGFSVGVKTLGYGEGTTVTSVTSLAPFKQKHRKLKIILLGLGTVGYGVYQHLLAAPERFEVVGVGIKHLRKHAARGIPAHLISEDLTQILSRDADVVVELIGEPTLSEQWITQALQQRRHVVTANKFLVSEKGHVLEKIAEAHQVKFFYSAAVAGAVPILEFLSVLKKIHRQKTIQSVTGILNGTCNFVLDQVGRGETFAHAIALAQQAGFAEADPSLDINGRDAAQKLRIISAAAFNIPIPDFPVFGIQSLDEAAVHQAAKADQVVKLIAHCTREADGLRASVQPTFLPRTHRLAGVSGVDNCILIRTTDDEVMTLQGKGAGRWPTAEAVYADLLDLSV